MVALGDFAAGPLLLPGCPVTPAPEFGLVGCCCCAFCAKAGAVRTNGKTVRIAKARIMLLPVVAKQQRPMRKVPPLDRIDSRGGSPIAALFDTAQAARRRARPFR